VPKVLLGITLQAKRVHRPLAFSKSGIVIFLSRFQDRMCLSRLCPDPVEEDLGDCRQINPQGALKSIKVTNGLISHLTVLSI
jgi:hypothetical protein